MDLVSALPTLTLPNTLGAPAIPLQPGQVVQAVVLALLENGAFRLQLPNAVLDVRAQVPLTPGSTVKLVVKGAGPNARLVVIPDTRTVSAFDETAGRASGGRTEIVVTLADPSQRAALGEASHLDRHRAAADLVKTTARPVVDAPALVPKDSPARAPASAVALSEAVRVAAARQGGLSPLMTNLERLARDERVPGPVRAAATQLLDLRVPLGSDPTATDIRQAMARSGLFLEQRLERDLTTPRTANAPVPASSPDLKAALLVLRHVLSSWAAELPATPPVRAPASQAGAPVPVADFARALANPGVPAVAADLVDALQALARSETPPQAIAEPASEHAASAAKPPPPYRAAPTAAQPPAPASIAEDMAPREIAERLIGQADAALARATLLQAASLPDRIDDAHREQGPRWTFEIPFAAAQGTAIAQFEVSRDGAATPMEAQASVWRARFSLDVEPMGPVHALVTLAGARTSVTLWAERMTTVSRLNTGVAMLGDALRAAELEPGDIQFRLGSPRAIKPAAPGKFMDRAT